MERFTRLTRQHWPLLLGVAQLLWLHHAGWFQGKVYALEDVAAFFYGVKGRFYNLAHGTELWSWWDPLWLLGMPRLANVQAGWFSPWSVWFALVPSPSAWRFYPLLIDLCLLGSAYFALLRIGLSRAAAGWAAAVWVCCGNVLITSQYPCYKESLLASCLMLGFFCQWLDRGYRRDLVALCVAGALHLTAGSPSALFFDHLCLGPFLLVVGWRSGCFLRRFVLGWAAYVSGFLLTSATWLAFADFFRHGLRSLNFVPGPEFADSYRLTFRESFWRLAGESHVMTPLLSEERPGYPLAVDFSVAVTVLAFSAVCIPKLRSLLLVAVVLTLQAMGERGGLMWLLHQVAPFTLQSRGPYRFLLLSTLFTAVVAGLAWDHWRRRGPGRMRTAATVLVLWGALFPVVAQFQSTRGAYVPADRFVPPPYPPVNSGRVAVLRFSKPSPPLVWESLGTLYGLATLVLPDPHVEKGYLLGMAYSQWGAVAKDRIGAVLRRGGHVALTQPDRPLMLEWGLTWLLQGKGGTFEWVRLQPDPPRHWLAQAIGGSAEAWASRTSGEPRRQAHVAEAVPTHLPTGLVTVALEQADAQRLHVQGLGLLVSDDQWDPGWRCYHDGRPAQVLRANLAQKACWVEPGTSVVEWRYELPWLRRFWICHILGWVVLAGCVILGPDRSAESKYPPSQ